MPKRKKNNIYKRMEVLYKQDYKCLKCQVLLHPRLFEVDHILALCLGGDNTPENLQALCLNCHALKTVNDNEKFHTSKRKAKEYWSKVFHGPF